MKKHTLALFSSLFFLLLPCGMMLHGSDLYLLVPQQAQAVIRTDLTKMAALANLFNGSGQNVLSLSGGLPADFKMQQHCPEIVTAAMSLRKNASLVFCKVRLQEPELLALIRKMPKAVIQSKKTGKYVLHTIRFNTPEQQHIYISFLRKDIILFSDRDHSWYLLNSNIPKGLTAEQRSWIRKDQFISGYAVPDRKFYRKNLMLPRFTRIIFHTQVHKDGAVTFFAHGPLRDGEDPDLKVQQLQQALMIGSLFLNSVDPSMAEEFMKSGSITGSGKIVYYRQYLSAPFLKKFIEKTPALLTAGREMIPPRKRKAKTP